MSGEKTTKTVFRMLMAWNDEKEERWLAEHERSGWHLKAVRGFGYTFERATPADAAYRLDFYAGPRENRQEYLSIFLDAGWEHVGERGHWHYFRHGLVNGKAPEIFSDPESRIAKYRRVMAMMGVFIVLLTVVISPKWPSEHVQGPPRLVETVYASAFYFKLAVTAFLLYAMVRLALVISRLKRAKPIAA